MGPEFKVLDPVVGAVAVLVVNVLVRIQLSPEELLHEQSMLRDAPSASDVPLPVAAVRIKPALAVASATVVAYRRIAMLRQPEIVPIAVPARTGNTLAVDEYAYRLLADLTAALTEGDVRVAVDSEAAVVALAVPGRLVRRAAVIDRADRAPGALGLMDNIRIAVFQYAR